MNKKIDDAISTIMGNTSKSLEKFESFNSKVDLMTRDIEKLKKNLESSKSTESTISYILGVCVLGLISVCAYIAINK
jgi:hypothetical protein